jgi:hypothetical protein
MLGLYVGSDVWNILEIDAVTTTYNSDIDPSYLTVILFITRILTASSCILTLVHSVYTESALSL